ncbi:dnaJ homolog subfamily C member 4 [Xylocopa sonorina]|uniref:dnaJ homolog subfamily C member 4 n=1 Tax=Xylocopa sonorina TaxID=1818115 RepID=UPI00403AC628
MAQISRAYKFEVPMLIRVLCKGFHCQRCEYSYYEILRISPNATQKEIKAAYIKLSKEMHPDSGTKGCHADFVKINEAYTVLSKKETRDLYDAQLKSHTIYRNNSYQHTEYIFIKKSYVHNDYYKQRKMYNVYHSQQKRKVLREDRQRAIKLCAMTIIAGILLHIIMIKRWSDHNRDVALKRSAEIQKNYEYIRKRYEGKTLEERLQIFDELRKGDK